MLRDIQVFLPLLFSSHIAWGKPACDDLAGGVVFYDTAFGVATGVLLTGLFVVATKTNSDAGQKLAVGGLVGGLAGAATGALELGMRQCAATSSEVKVGVVLSPVLVDLKPAARLTWHW